MLEWVNKPAKQMSECDNHFLLKCFAFEAIYISFKMYDKLQAIFTISAFKNVLLCVAVNLRIQNVDRTNQPFAYCFR